MPVRSKGYRNGNPHESPYEAYATFMNVVEDVERRAGREHRAEGNSLEVSATG